MLNAHVNARDKYNNTALIWASTNGHEKIVEALLNEGADVNAVNNMDRTAIDLAALNGHTKALEKLIFINYQFF